MPGMHESNASALCPWSLVLRWSRADDTEERTAAFLGARRLRW